MKPRWKTLKRCIAMLLTLSILLSCTNMGFFTHVHAVEEQGNPGITLGNIIANNYELSDVEKEILKSGNLSADVTFKYTLPPEEANDDNKLVIVDRENSNITVAEYKDEMGNVWVAKRVYIKVNDATVETIALVNGECTYTYDGNAFAVVAEYVLTSGDLKNSITNAQQLALLNAVLYLAEDVDYMQMIDKDVFATMMDVELTPNAFLDIMAVNNPVLGDTPINLLYSLVEGFRKSVQLPGDAEPTNISIKLEGDAAAAAQSLKDQQDKNGQLDLPYFMKTHACSYLEMLYNDSYRAGLEEALNQNIADIEGLLADGGLNDVYVEMVVLKTSTIPSLEKKVYKAINDQMPTITSILGTIPGVQGKVDKLSEVEAIQKAVDEYYQNALKDANDLLDDKIASGELDESWVPEGGIQEAADLKELMDNVQTVYDNVITEINSLLSTYGTQYGISFPTVNGSADIQAVEDTIDDYLAENLNTLNKTIAQYNTAYGLSLPAVSYTGLDGIAQTIEDVEALQLALADAKEDLKDMLDGVNTTLDNLGYTGADVDSAADIDAVILPWQNAIAEENRTIENEQINAEKALGSIKLLLQTRGITYNKPINTSADIDALVDYLGTLAGDEVAEANALIATLRTKHDARLATVKGRLSPYYYTKTVQSSADMNAAIAYMTGNPSEAEKAVWAKVNAGLQGAITVNSVADIPGAKSTLQLALNFGVLTQADYNEAIEALDKAQVRVEAIPGEAAALQSDKTALIGIEAELKAAEDALANAGGEIATLIGYVRTEQGKFNTANANKAEAEANKAAYETKIAAANSLRSQLEQISKAQSAIAEAEVLLSKLHTVLSAMPAMLAQLEEGEDLLKKAEDALDLLDDYYQQMVDAEEKMDLIDQAVDGLKELETYKDMLEEYLSYLPMLIGIFEDFGYAVQPVSDRIYDNAWNVKKHVKAGADFDDLTDAAEGLIGKALYTDADLKSANELVVATANTQYNMSMFTVSVVYKAAVVNPALVDSDELYNLIDYTGAKITLEAGATKAQILQAIQVAGSEAAALKSWSAYKVNGTNFVRTESSLPDTLTQNITYVVEYAPKTLSVSYNGMTGPATVLYDYRMTLPVCQTEGREYTYKVNGTYYYQGQVVTLTKDTTIVRTEGDKSTDRNMLDLVVNATSVNDSVKKILSSSALAYAESVKIRFPSAALLDVNTNQNILTANKYENAIGNKAWIALSAVTKDISGTVLENLNSFVNDQTPYSKDFAIAEVLYQISFTAADANTTNEKVLTAMNFANVLTEEYIDQKAALDFLSADAFMNALTMLDGKDSTISGYLSMAQSALATDPAKPALDTIINDLNNSSNGKLTLYNLLFNYKEQGMVYYYKNYTAIRNELTKMQNAMEQLTSSEKFMGIVASQDQGLHDKLLGIKDSLLATVIPAKNSKIVTTNDTALKQLVADLDAYANVGITNYNSVGELKWSTTLSATVGVKVITVNVQFGAQSAALKLSFAEGEALTAADIQNLLDQLAQLEAEMGVDKVHYVRNGNLPKVGDVMDKNLTDAELTYDLVWTAKSYDVIVDGDVVGSVTYEDPYFTLPTHSDPEYRYDYIVGGALYAQGDTANFRADFDTLFASGSLTIVRKEVDKIREQLLTYVDRMNGAVTLVEHGDRDFSLVLKINPDTATADLSNFVMGMLMSGYGYIGMDGNMFYGTMTDENGIESAPQFHLQAMIDMLLNSGLGTQTVLDMYGSKGFINLPLKGQIISAAGGNMNALGGELLATTMSFGSTADDDLEVDFYITMPDSEMLQSIRNALDVSKSLFYVALQNGQIEASINLPEPVYAAYLAALTMVGETDIRSIDQMNAEIALGFLFALIDPLIGEEDVSTETFENTLEKFGQSTDLSAYAESYKQMQSVFNALEAHRTYTDTGCLLTFEDISINAAVDWLQTNVIASLAAGFGVSADDIKLSSMIYEYKPADADDSREYGLDINIHAELGNLHNTYAAMFIDVRGDGASNMIGLLTVEEVAGGALANMNGPAIVILLTDINHDLVINSTTMIDLNGKTVNGSLTARDTTIVTDNYYLAAEPGSVTGKISGSVTIVDGVYPTDVSAFLLEGYEQLASGAVSNKLYTITSDETNHITVTLHTNASSLRELANMKSTGSLGIDIAVDLMLNHYNMAALYIGSEGGEMSKIFDVRFEDLVDMITGKDRVTGAVNTILSHTSLSDLADLLNAITDDMTDFAALEKALTTDGVITTYLTETATWKVGFEHIEDGDYMTMVLTSGKTTPGSLTVAIDGGLTDELTILLGAMAETITIDSELDLDDLEIDSNGLIDLVGSYKGIIDIDFTVDRNYVIMMAVILAHNNASVRSDLVNAIIAYYDGGETSMVELEDAFKKLSADDLTDALANNNRAKSFSQMVKDLGLKGIVDEEIGNDRMGYGHVIDLLGIGLGVIKDRGLLESFFGSDRTLGSFVKTDALGEYFGFSTNLSSENYRDLFGGYSAGYNLSLSELSIKLRLFSAEDLVIVTNENGVKIGAFDNLEAAFALANNNPGSTITVTGGVSALNDLEVNTQITLVGVKRITIADGVKFILNTADAKLTTDKAIDGNVAVADTAAYCLKIDSESKNSVYTAFAHFDSATDSNHVCDNGCGLEIEDCSDVMGDGDHNCDVCDERVEDCFDNTGDHLCDECGAQVSLCTDANNDHLCDECGATISVCTDTVGDGDHACDICGMITSLCKDTDNDHLCDECDAVVSLCYDANGDGDHTCDACGKITSLCADADNDHYCDECDAQLSVGSDAANDDDHACDICGTIISLCADKNNDHLCDECDKAISLCADKDNNHLCDLCGEKIENCSVDANNDHLCDICGAVISVCTDAAGDGDHLCDICGKVTSLCADKNNDHFCDECGTKLSTCVDVEGDGNHFCEICGAIIGLCADLNNDHYCDECGLVISICVDANNDHVCDICGIVTSLCADNDNDHKCDACGTVISLCADGADSDHKCDTCGIVIENCYERDNDHYCDECGEQISVCIDANNDHVCDICGEETSLCKDTDNDHLCDECGEKISDCVDADNDHFCDICGEKISDCADADNDHYCDECGAQLSACSDVANDGDHNCDICGKVTSLCADTNNDHNCDECGAVISVCVDANDDHLCDICGEKIENCSVDANNDHLCDECGAVISLCADANNDHNCDICGKVISLCTDTVGDADHLCDICGKITSLCADNDNDHLCDECGEQITVCSDAANDGDHLCDICGKVTSLCADANNDHLCDECDAVISLCIDADTDGYCDICGCELTCAHEDLNGDHLCDKCGVVISTCSDAIGDGNHVCDICGKLMGVCTDKNSDHLCDECGVVISQCFDADNNHLCDICRALISVCVDNNKDHICEICGGRVGSHADKNKDHNCDYGCSDAIGDHLDDNFDHKCDYGCSELIGDHTDANQDHNCDYGCDQSIGNHVDNNKDHDCDYGCDQSIGDHVDSNKDHNCDYGCSDLIGDHIDADFDHDCDYSCSDLIGMDKHVDANKNHKCDYGCDASFGSHVDGNTDHVCDYGCSEFIGDHVDANKDHICDYGCSESIGDHADYDHDHDCDYCDETLSTCADNNKDGKCDVCGTQLIPLPTVGTPIVTIGNKIMSYQVDHINKILYLDTHKNGVTMAQLEALLEATTVPGDADGKVSIKVVNKDNVTLIDTDLVPTGAKITLIASNVASEATAEYSIVVIGDTNCNGKIENNDAVLISLHYLGQKMLTGLALDAADTNRNGRLENNDAVLISVKYVNPDRYQSHLIFDRMG